MNDFVKKPCKTCPFNVKVKPFLHPDRAYDIAASSFNPYNNFPCHNTIEYTDEEDCFGESVPNLANAKECAGFLTMRATETEKLPEGFVPSFEDVYESPTDMYYAYKEEWNKKS